jgi:hypothetical protein
MLRWLDSTGGASLLAARVQHYPTTAKVHRFSSPPVFFIPLGPYPLSGAAPHHISSSGFRVLHGTLEISICGSLGGHQRIDLVFTIAGLVCFYILRRHGPSLPAIRRRVTPPQNLILRSYPRYNWLQALQAIVLGMFASQHTSVVVRSCALLGLSLLSM